jgi:hypothetical protein
MIKYAGGVFFAVVELSRELARALCTCFVFNFVRVIMAKSLNRSFTYTVFKIDLNCLVNIEQ